MSTIAVTTEDGTQLDLEIHEGGVRVLPASGKDRIGRDQLASIDSGSDREDAEPIDAAHAA